MYGGLILLRRRLFRVSAIDYEYLLPQLVRVTHRVVGAWGLPVLLFWRGQPWRARRLGALLPYEWTTFQVTLTITNNAAMQLSALKGLRLDGRHTRIPGDRYATAHVS